MYIGITTNECGTPVSKHKCDTCGNEYTVCPALDKDSTSSLAANCQDDVCPSYNPANDIDVFFMTDKEIAEKKPLVSIDMLRKRKTGKLEIV